MNLKKLADETMNDIKGVLDAASDELISSRIQLSLEKVRNETIEECAKTMRQFKDTLPPQVGVIYGYETMIADAVLALKGDNLKPWALKHGRRHCRKCHNKRSVEYQRRKKEFGNETK